MQTTTFAQRVGFSVKGKISAADSSILAGVTVELLSADSIVIRIVASNPGGQFEFEDVATDKFHVKATATGHLPYWSKLLTNSAGQEVMEVGTIMLEPVTGVLSEVTISSRRRPLLEMKAGSTIVNVDAAITNVGATVLEVLEKSPGVVVDRNGNISVKGRKEVLVLIDGKQTYLSSAELASMLASMPSSQVDQIEIMTNPSARYDAAGSTGIIDIRMKKIKSQGFNGSVSTSYGQGIYPKSNNTVLLNLRHNKMNVHASYNVIYNENYVDLYAFRWYMQPDGTVYNSLEQPSYLTSKVSSQNVRAGVDYSLSRSSSISVGFSGIDTRRTGRSISIAEWLKGNALPDSVIDTRGITEATFRNFGISSGLKHRFDETKTLSADIDYLNYRITNDQRFDNTLKFPGTYQENFRGDIPGTIEILASKLDYSQQLSTGSSIEAGLKSSRVNTRNTAEYFYQINGNPWIPDYGKTNDFVYSENIHAAYVNMQNEISKWKMQGGIRYEYTSYDAVQLGNVQRSDSSFSRKYDGVFPSLHLGWKVDSVHTISFSAVRRIDRPPFQKLNPFVFIINKYTLQQGNPYFLPQFTWNMELSHSFGDKLITTLGYGITRDYFSQIFLSDTNDILIYSEGNLDRMRLLSLSVAGQVAIAPWWNLSGQVTVSRKQIEGFVWNERVATLTQANFNISNQFNFSKGWSGEFSGFFTTREQELQEITDPTGQVGIGIAKQLFQNRAVVKLSARDIFYSQVMKGWTSFEGATEYFRLQRDTRILHLAFTYRFGKAAKSPRNNSGSANEEIKRAGSI